MTYIYSISLLPTEDEDDISVANAKTIGGKRKYNESVSDVMSLKSQSTSRYRGNKVLYLKTLTLFF